MKPEEHCQRLVNYCMEFLEGELTGAELEEFRRHLADCPFCRQCVEEIFAVRSLLQNLPPAPLPAELKERLRVCLERAHKK